MSNGGKINELLIPQVSRLPGQKTVDISHKLDPEKAKEFRGVLDAQIDQADREHGIKLSLHAAKRMNERSMQLDNDEFLKIKEGLDRLKEKGGKDSLVITAKGLYIVDVDNNKIVTALDQESLNENVITKIDSTVIVK